MTQVYIENTALWFDVEKIFKSDSPVPVFKYEVEVHTVDEDFDIVNILSINISRDYVNKVGDQVMIKFQFPKGTYVKKFYPKRHNLEVTIKRIKLAGAGYYDDLMALQDVERFKAVFIPDENENINLKLANSFDEFSLNHDLVTITLQLLNRTLEPLRIKTLYGTFSDVSREDLMRAILGGESYKVLIDGKPGIDAIDIAKPNNEEKIKQIVFPNNTPVLSIPTFIQERHTGVYTGGIGTYLQTFKQKRTWFIYPIFDITRFDEPIEKIIVYSVPSRQFNNTDRTYMVEDKTIHLAATGQKSYVDDDEASQMQAGIGFRQADGDAFMDKPVKMTAKGPVGIRNKINTEVGLRDREDNLNYAPVADNAIAVNKFSQYSRHLINNGARIEIQWQNADPSLIYPGMPCKYVYLDEEEIKEVKGIVIGTHTLITTGSDTKGVKATDQTYSTTALLTLFVEKFTHAGEKREQLDMGNNNQTPRRNDQPIVDSEPVKTTPKIDSMKGQERSRDWDGDRNGIPDRIDRENRKNDRSRFIIKK